MADSNVTFEALIVPHRSLGRTGLRWVASILFVLSGGVSVGLFLAGAWPVIGFTGLEVVLAVWLLHRHALGRRASELLLLSHSGVQIVRIDRSGRRSERTVPAAWLRASLEERPGRTPALILRGRGFEVSVGEALGEEEKRGLAAALQEAIERQQRPVFDNEQLREVSPREISPRSDPST